MDGLLLALLLAFAAMLYTIRRAWRRFQPQVSNGIQTQFGYRRWLIQIGLFVVIYCVMVGLTLIAFTLVGVNFTLVSSFLGAPLWILYVIIARAWARSLARVLEPSPR